eukprot:gnl/TRDRNA2_/TRDRNA2_129695_c1_seq1.p2 gnl/TRDRNA2_/TRDRNA2_129695_c1~~gnl/TRDRNA2_/TRDRNA2_129695_c1_seq1.p2  ORF type:complete len:103 (-),score=13.80 gnl/TRDRNA2_/TRDRNA2_129695_c1_seq1:78-386(-)
MSTRDAPGEHKAIDTIDPWEPSASTQMSLAFVTQPEGIANGGPHTFSIPLTLGMGTSSSIGVTQAVAASTSFTGKRRRSPPSAPSRFAADVDRAVRPKLELP